MHQNDDRHVAAHLQVRPKSRFPKPIRLLREAYRFGHCFSVTIATASRQPFFESRLAFETAVECLRTSAGKHDAVIYAYCFMPDHLHLLAQTPEGADLSEFVRNFKQISAYRLKRQLATPSIWQSSYYDHALRRAEDLLAVAEYIFNNPVRAGLADSQEDYPFSGSFESHDPPIGGPKGPQLHPSAASNVATHLQVPPAHGKNRNVGTHLQVPPTHGKNRNVAAHLQVRPNAAPHQSRAVLKGTAG